MNSIKKTTALVTLALALIVALAGTALAAAGTEIDMTIADNQVAYNDAIFIQGPIDVNSAGTGVIDPFLSVGGGGNQAITKGYNTVDASAEFDTITGGDRTRPLLLSGIPEVEIGGEFYREFKLDINKAVGGNEFMALNELKLFLTDDPAITGYDYAGGTEFGANATKVWDLGDAVVLMDYSLESGSGQSDVSFFVKSSVFSTAEDCSYGASECTTYLVMWNEYGNYSDSALYPSRTWEDNDGFEEWGIVLRPVVEAEKTAAGSYDRTITWELTKSVSPEAHSGFIGDSFQSTWEVVATKSVDEGNYAASGTITIYNPTGCGDETCPVPEDVPAEILSVDDVIDQAGLETNASVDCGVTFPYTLGGEETLECTYTASPPNADDGLNTATITVAVPEKIGGGTDTYEAFADLAFTMNVIGDESVTVDDDRDTEGQFPANISDSTTFDYDETFYCSTDQGDYTDGVDSDNYPNTATATGDNTNLSDDADVDVTCYIWDVSKTANGSYQDQYKWDITKTVDPESQSGFAGDTLEWEWSITWSSSFDKEINHSVSGVITVDNPADQALTVDVSDELSGGFAATVTCNDGDGGTDLTIAANSSGTCDYSAAPSEQLAQNTATATRNDVSVSDTVNVNWTKSGDVGLDAEISDSNNVEIPVDSAQPFEYTESADCSTDAGAYGENGSYSGFADNTATITWTGGSDSDSAHTDYTCYIWDVSKTANGSYQDRYGWQITKTVDPESQTGYPGETLEWEWTITWSSYFIEEINHAVSGVITVDNPADQALTVDVSDELSGSFAATVTCNDGDGGTDLTIAANSSGTCDYSAAPSEQLAQNTATATRNDVSVSDTVNVNWTKSGDVGLDASISDTNHADIPVDSAQPYQYTDSHTCSTDAGAYGEDGMYSGYADNTAEITWTGGSDSDSAHTDYTCEASFVDLLKLTNGVENPEMSWSFELRQDGTTLESLSTPPTLLEFQTALVPGAEYTMCETGIPPSWTLQWALDSNGNGVIDEGETLPFVGGEADLTGDGLFQVYDPDPLYGQEGAVNDTRCVNFSADADAGDSLSFIVDNQRPGGEPRTPGYWKNWNTCSGGNQPQTAAKNGGPAEGWFLLDDLIPTTVGDLEIATCEDGVSILDQRDLNSGRKMASDAAYTLAMHLLAAKLNLAAGAETCPAVVDAVAAGDGLLSSIGFDGTGKYLRPKDAEYQTALDLAGTLDAYNNGDLCQ
jgi:hypothetical protein